MKRSDGNKVMSVSKNGQLIVSLDGKDSDIENIKGTCSEIWINEESRGYSTNYKRKPFLYLIIYHNGICKSIHGITRIAQLKTMFTHWANHNIDYKIHNQILFDKYITH